MSDTPLPLTLEALPELRRKTEAVSGLLRQQIAQHLETLRPLLAPERIFGKLARGKVEVSGADMALAELQQNYRRFTSKPYDLPADFDSTWLTLVGNSLELHPWEYTYVIDGKSISMSSPVRWIVNYHSNYNLAQVKAALTGKEKVRPEYLRQFVVNALVLQVMLARTPGLAALFADLRYELKSESPSDLRGLSAVTVTSILDSFRPPDNLILSSTAFSGVPAFIELVDLETVKQPKDLLKERIHALLQG